MREKYSEAHLEQFAETDDDRAVVLVVLVAFLLRVVRAHVVNDRAEFQDLAADVRLGSASSQVGFGAGHRSAKNKILIVRQCRRIHT